MHHLGRRTSSCPERRSVSSARSCRDVFGPLTASGSRPVGSGPLRRLARSPDHGYGVLPSVTFGFVDSPTRVWSRFPQIPPSSGHLVYMFQQILVDTRFISRCFPFLFLFFTSKVQRRPDHLEACLNSGTTDY